VEEVRSREAADNKDVEKLLKVELKKGNKKMNKIVLQSSET
jgi:hypothetical protein